MNNIDLTEDDDFGFSTISEEELNAKTISVENEYQDKLKKMHKMIVPLLNNLAKNPEKEYIYWPDRVKKLTEFRKKIDKLMDL